MLQPRHWFQWILLAALTTWLGAAQAHMVCVLSSEQSPAFQEAADSLTQEWLRAGHARNAMRYYSLREFAEAGGCGADTRLQISLGTEAFRKLVANGGHGALIAGLLPRASFERVLQESGRKAATSVAALYLDQPFGRQLDLLRLALPRVHRVGVLWGPESLAQQPRLQAAMQARGLEYSEAVLQDGQPLIGPLRAALQDADALLAVADASVYNAASVSNILLTSYRAGTPVLAFSPGYVKAGALLAVHSTATQAGAQIAAMAVHFIQANALPANQYPSAFTISVNPYVARSLELNLDPQSLSEQLHKLEKKP